MRRMMISARAGARLRSGHVWVYRSDLEGQGLERLGLADQALEDQALEDQEQSDLAGDGDASGEQRLESDGSIHASGNLKSDALVEVVDRRGQVYGSALYSAASQIALRLVSSKPIASRDEWMAEIELRIAASIALRRKLRSNEDSKRNSAERLVFSEADRLPGLVIDRYNDLTVIQLLAQGMDVDDVRQAVVRSLLANLTGDAAPRAIFERPDPRIRELEALPAPAAGPLYRAVSRESVRVSGRATGDPDSPPQSDGDEGEFRTRFHLNGLSFRFDANAGQKTGAFLDQRENYACAEHYANGRALDVCCYQGGFALHLARVCDSVTGVDVSRAALEVADANFEDNSSFLRAPDQVEWMEANAFDLMRDYADAGRQYDTIVLDPPAFAKTRRAVEGALRGYKDLHLRAFQMLAPGGILVTCSCSHHVTLAEFIGVISEAAADSKRTVQLLETRGAAVDHPSILTIPETSYLKCLVLLVR